jgi:dienelactone hydrolase
MMRAVRLAIVVLCLNVCAALQPAAADGFYREDLRIPFAAAGPRGLEALLIRPAGAGRYPLALISHGTDAKAELRQNLTPYRYYRQAIELARRGFAAVVVMRRGYGDSGGDYAEAKSCCDIASFLRTAKADVDDLRAAVAAMKNRNDVTTQGMIAVGVSTGGFATVALASDAPAGLVAAINFAGGIRRDDGEANDSREADDRAALVETFRMFGSKSGVPTLWIYAANDSNFSSDLAHRMLDAFRAGGGRARLVDAPAFGRDGHSLFGTGTSNWLPTVDDFLREQNLGLREPLAPPPLPAVPVPPQFTGRGRSAFAEYLAAGAHKAFAVSPKGLFGYATGSRSTVKSRAEALAACAQYGPDCAVYAVDDELAATADAVR